MLDQLIDDAVRLTRGALVLLLLAAGTWLTTSAALFGLNHAFPRGCRRPPVPLTQLRLKVTHEAIAQFEAKHGRCPTDVTELVDSRYLTPNNAKDGWGAPIAITCDAQHDDIFTRSPGPDGERGTPDDLTIGRDGPSSDDYVLGLK